MATVAILERLSRPAPATASTPAIGASAWPRPRSVDYDVYRAEARRLRNEAIRDTWLLVGRLLKRMVAR
jgi:hypothetical protein